MPPPSATERLIDIVAHLGGPRIIPGDIEWAVDLPAGKQLVDWIAAQLDSDDERGSDGGVDRALRVSMKDIALEPEEVYLWVILRRVSQVDFEDVFQASDCRVNRSTQINLDGARISFLLFSAI